jgi:hypothetical protein
MKSLFVGYVAVISLAGMALVCWGHGLNIIVAGGVLAIGGIIILAVSTSK